MDNLFLFTGDDTFRLHAQMKSWKEAFKEKYGDMNLAVLNGAESEVGDMISQIEAMPFLGEKRLIFIEGLPEAPKTRNADKVTKKDEARDEELKRLTDYLEKIPETSVMVFVQPAPDKRKSLYKKIVQLATVKEFIPLTGIPLNQWVENQAKTHGTSISSEDAEYLVSLAGQDLWRIDQELRKLSAYREGQPVDRKAIDQLVIPTIEANVFHLTDALGAKDHRKAVQNLHRTMAAGENLRQTFYMIVRQFRLFLQVGGYLNNYPSTSPANIATFLKIHPFVAKNTMGQLKHFKLEELKSAYARLLDIDVALKTSGIRITTDDQDELAMAIERFILRFCTTA
ncbi:DNA polymerase III subunit delta [Candidatus Peregrinibacteria bacterium]|nr:DNA polymerase III subunit delta [Candidatus Peregrinibacteria bacterium]